MSPMEKAKIEKEEKATFIVDEAIAESEGYAHLGEISPRTDANGVSNVTVTEDQIKYDARDVVARRNEGKPVVPVFYFTDPNTGETHWVLTDEDGAAMEEGYICENCLGWQQDASSWECKTIHNFNCGYSKVQL